MSDRRLASIWLDPPPSIETDRFDSNAHYDVAVVGAGLTGLATALLLPVPVAGWSYWRPRSVGAVTTGHSTAKVTLLQGTRLSTIVANHTEHVAGAYVEGNREAQAWLVDYAAEHGVQMEHRDAYTYAGSQSGAPLSVVSSTLPGESDCRWRWLMLSSCPIPPMLRFVCRINCKSIQWTSSPRWRGAARHGRVLIEGVRVTGVTNDESCELLTAAGNLTADTGARHRPTVPRPRVVLRQGHRASLVRPGACDADPRGMYISADSPTCSPLRTALYDGEELLLVGGNGHPVGRHPMNPSELGHRSDRLDTPVVPGAERTHVWSAQDYVAHGGVPFVGKLPRAAATCIWRRDTARGMTNAVAAAMRISGEILDDVPSWARTLGTRVSKPASAFRYSERTPPLGSRPRRGGLMPSFTR